MNRKFVSVMTLIIVLIGMSFVVLNIQKVEAIGTIYIRANGLIEGTDKITSADNITYTFKDNINDSIVVERCNIIVDGNGYLLQGLGSTVGFNLTSVKNVTIRNANIIGFGAGIFINSSANVIVYGSHLTSNENGYSGICIVGSINTTVFGNIAAPASAGSCITLYSSLNSTIYGNIIKNAFYGTYLTGEFYSGSPNNTIYGNDIIDNVYGIWLERSSNHNTIYENNITGNHYGIKIYDSHYNKIFHNNFINNTYQAEANEVNYWDNGYPSGGNYWSDYTGQDVNGDGIGDEQYFMNSYNIDHYPLMVIIPEFPSFLILPLFMIAILLAVIVYKRKYH